MSHAILMTEAEIDSASLSANYQEVVAAGENQLAHNMMIRNTTTFRLLFRVAGDDTQTFTVSPNEKFLIGGFSNLRGQLLEVKTVPDVPASLRLNQFG